MGLKNIATQGSEVLSTKTKTSYARKPLQHLFLSILFPASFSNRYEDIQRESLKSLLTYINFHTRNQRELIISGGSEIIECFVLLLLH